ncbi:hypothetical protein VMCG_04272 [Cytospora schulzeri]|uniref:Uncharacterized protein n=1 Tax=Cytospora schulzeri TaxID=448051 RepID=A0A423WSV2_9PEZI|nr:hypothetical protein VMCG_04272 [Valsa malicola]
MPLDGNDPMCPSRSGAIRASAEENPIDVRAIGDMLPPAEEGQVDVLKKQGLADFMTKVSIRLRSTHPPYLRVQVRRAFFGLLRGLNLDVCAEPPYDSAAADRLREFLVAAGRGEVLLLDFEAFLKSVRVEAQKRKERAEKVAKALEEERRNKGEWDMIEKSDVEEPWEMI